MRKIRTYDKILNENPKKEKIAFNERAI